VGKIPRTKGAKNKKTLLKEKKLQKTVDAKVKSDGKQVDVEPIVIPEEPKQRMALRLFTLEKKVHDDFMNYIFQLGDPKLYESYIVNEIMTKYVNGKIKLPKIDRDKLHEYMLAFGKVGFEPDVIHEVDEFKAANRLIHRKQNSFIQYQYAIVVDPDIKLSMSKTISTSYLVNELLKLYSADAIKIDLRDFRIKEWEPKYKYVMKKESKSK
jgi:hypothetical protein